MISAMRLRISLILPLSPRIFPSTALSTCLCFSSAANSFARYSPSHDFIQVPPQQAYFEPINWYRTVLHELGHYSGHPSRLNRNFSGRHGSEAYAREELVAELCFAFLCAELGVTPTGRHADYLGAWLEILKGDNRAIFQAASLASKAAEFVMGRMLSG